MIALTDLDVYKLGEQISDMVWSDYDHWPEKAQRTIGFQNHKILGQYIN
jgi:hypothetical protein